MSSGVDPSERSTNIKFLAGESRIAAESIPDELACLTQDELEVMRRPTAIDFWLKKSLWSCFEKAKSGAIVEIWPRDIYTGVCSKQAFFKIIVNPIRMAWLMSIPVVDKDMAAASLSAGLHNLFKFVSKEPTQETIGAFIRAIDFLYTRVHGPVVQRIDSRNVNVNVNRDELPPTVEAANARLMELKHKLSSGRDVTPPIQSEDEKTEQ